MLYQNIIVFLIIILAVIASIKTRKLTIAGAITGGIIAIAIYKGIGWLGLLMLGSFFLLGTLATAWQARTKNKLGMAEKNSGRRTMGQVLANGGVAGIIGTLAIIFPENLQVWILMIAGSFSAAIADTLSSELGTIYGKRFYNCISFKKEQRGLDGVISIEGLLIGMAGSMLIAFIYSLYVGWTNAWIVILSAGTLGNLADSVLGATLERKNILPNNAVNFFNTLVGVLTALLLSVIFHLF